MTSRVVVLFFMFLFSLNIFAQDAFEPDDLPSLQSPGLYNYVPQQHNFHTIGDTDWAISWMGANIRGAAVFRAVNATSINKWHAELYYSEDGSYTRVLAAQGDFGAQTLTLNSETLPTAGRLFWVKVTAIDPNFIGPSTVYTMEAQALGPLIDADAYEPDDQPSLQSSGLYNYVPQQHNFHTIGDTDWAISWMGANIRGAAVFRAVNATSINKWHAELYYSEDGSHTRVLAAQGDFGAQTLTLNSETLLTAGRLFWVKVTAIDPNFIGPNTPYTMEARIVGTLGLCTPTLNAPATINTTSLPLTWSNATGCPTPASYELRYGTSTTGPWTTVIPPGTANSITVTLPGSGTYYSNIRACIAANCSAYSANVQTLVASVPLPPQLFPAASAPPTSAEIAASSKVGSLDGSLRVGESGAVNFSVGFVTAPGKGGLVPEMGLAYSGDTSLGVAGIGFNLTGLSAVSRCRKTIEAGDGPGPHPQVNFDTNASNDAFCLDGQRLLQVATGTQSIDGTSYPYTEFRTEIETFQRVRAYASPAAATGEQLVYGPLFWRVDAKDGSIRDYGRGYSDLVTNAAVYANDGQLLFQIDPSTGLKIPRRLLSDTRQHIATWALSATADRLGSRVRYRYDTGYTAVSVNLLVAFSAYFALLT